MTMVGATDEERRALRLLRRLSAVEGVTLLLLLGVAVPLKHLAGLPQATAILGPLHGLAFLAFCWALVQAAVGGAWPRGEVARLALGAMLPFGGFVNERRLYRRERTLSAGGRMR
ncbi:DUF3817 domain-containing protein [Zavarzinia sp. CC-PAN008]|uniref:DUF3817 domain-containing protein n=1 Tax=Zavarzinia sp. CC-PAN008 TaxID=3243332 RepID=UPI003F746E46